MEKTSILVVGDTGEQHEKILEAVSTLSSCELLPVADAATLTRYVGHSRRLLIIADGVPLPAALTAQLAAPSWQAVPAVRLSDETNSPPYWRNRLGIHLVPECSPGELSEAIQTLLQDNAPTPPRQQLTSLLQYTPQALIALDAQQQLIFYNETAQQLFKLPEAQLAAGKPLHTFPTLARLFPEGSGKHDTFSHELTLDDGTILNTHISNISGIGHIAICHNITADKNAEHFKTAFVQRVSHDIRSPLTSILGYVELIDRMGPVNEHQRKFIERITFSVQSITALLSNLLELNRIEADFSADREATQFTMIVRYAIEGCRQRVRAKSHTLEVVIPETVSPVLGNPIHLRQMVHNLLDNAIKFTPEGGSIQVMLLQQDDVIMLHVKDNGVGIPMDDQPRIFERFFRSANVKEQWEGSGLGLSIAKSIIDKHNGRIWVESEETVGTTVTVILPAHQAEPDQARIITG